MTAYSKLLATLAFLLTGSLFAADNPIDQNDSRQVAAQAYVDLAWSKAEALIPQKTPRYSSRAVSVSGSDLKVSARCPNCGSNQDFFWNTSKPNEARCNNCSITVPSSTYNEAHTLTLNTYEGNSVDMPYYQDGNGEKYFFSGMIDAFKYDYTERQLSDCAYTYGKTSNSTRFATRIRDISLIMADRFENWVTVGKDGYIAFDPAEPSQALLPNRVYLNNSIGADYPAFIGAFGTVRDDAELDWTTRGTTARDWIDEKLVKRYMHWLIRTNPILNVQDNRGPRFNEMSGFMRTYNSPEAAHYMLRLYKASEHYHPVGPDGMSNEGMNYQYLWFDLALEASLSSLLGWVDPAGYIDPVDGTNISTPLRHDDILIDNVRWQQIIEGPLSIVLPDGSDPSLHDSGVSSSLYGFDYGNPMVGKNYILPYFGEVIFGDGRGDTGQQFQTQMQFSDDITGHDHNDTLSLSVFGKGRRLYSFAGHCNYTHGSHNKNLVLVDEGGQNQYLSKTLKGNVEVYAATMPGLSIARVENNQLVLGGGYTRGGTRIDRYRRTILQNSVDVDNPYVLDIFEVTGGKIHDYMMAGNFDSLEEQTISTTLPLTSVPNAPGAPNSSEKGWLMFSDAKEAPLAECYVDVMFKDTPDVGVRTWWPAQGDGTLSLSILNEEWNSPRKHMRVRREAAAGATSLQSRFIAIHEPRDGASKISKVEQQALPGGDAVAVTVTRTDGRIDTYLISFEGAASMSHNGFSANALIAATAIKGSDSDVWMVGGTQANNGSRTITGTHADETGNLLRLTRVIDGDTYDSIITDMALPVGFDLAGQSVLIEGLDASGYREFTYANTIHEIVDLGTGEFEIRLRNDHGMALAPDGSISEIYAKKRSAASAKIRFINNITSVPHITHMDPSLNYWKPVTVDQHVPFDQSVDVNIYTLPASSVVKYTSDGSDPLATSPTFQNKVTLTSDTQLRVQTDNPGGLTTPDQLGSDYLKQLEGFPATGITPGLDFEKFYVFDEPYLSGEKKVIDSLLHEDAILSGYARGKGAIIDGYIEVPTTGFYRFYASVDSSYELKIDGHAILYYKGLRNIARWDAGIYLTAGFHRLEIKWLTERNVGFFMNWEGPGIPYGPIPAHLLFKELEPVVMTEQSTISVPEGGTATVKVKLSLPPAQNVTVTTSHTSGDHDVSIQPGSSLTFTPSNWDSWQTLTLSAATDSDNLNGQATFTFSSSLQDTSFTAEEADASAPVSTQAWSAYNDFHLLAGEPSSNISSIPAGNSGALINYATGNALGVSIDITGGTTGNVSVDKSDPAAGTEAYATFNGIVGCQGYIGYNGALTISLSGLDAAKTYEAIFYGCRGKSTYDNVRFTEMTINGADSFVNNSSAGAAISNSGKTTTLSVYNKVRGSLFRYSQIDPGSDGIITFTVPNPPAGDSGKYYLNAMKLTASASTSVGFTTWASTNGLSGAIDTDFDNDGVKDFIEYALGMNPHLDDASAAGRITHNGANVEYRFREPIAAVTHTVESSSDLINWAPYTSITPVQDGGDLKYTIPASVQNKLFLRLKLEE